MISREVLITLGQVPHYLFNKEGRCEKWQQVLATRSGTSPMNYGDAPDGEKRCCNPYVTPYITLNNPIYPLYIQLNPQP